MISELPASPTQRAVESIAAFVRCAWRAIPPEADYVDEAPAKAIRLDVEKLARDLRTEFAVHGIDRAFLDGAEEGGTPPGSATGAQSLPRRVAEALVNGSLAVEFFNPLQCARQWLKGTVSDTELKYFTFRAIRKRHGMAVTSETVRGVHAAARNIRHLLGAEKKWRCRLGSEELIPDYFLETCACLGWVRPLPGAEVQFEVRWIDAEMLLSSLFGLPTSIPGFDEIFGGGIMLPDEPASQAEAPPSLGGRVAIVMGPFGSGKSLLSLQVAVEVARKGGVAWVMALEQSFAECCYSLEAIGVPTHDPRFVLIHDFVDAFPVLADPEPGIGALVFLRPDAKTYKSFLESLGEKLSWMQRYPLRLFVVDPINALVDSGKSEPASGDGKGSASNEKARTETIHLFENAKRNHVNLWFACEQPSHDDWNSRFVENIADTVIHVGGEEANAGSHRRRILEVTKSRLQRERPGRHSFYILPGSGLRIYPSSEAIQHTLAIARIEPSQHFVKLGTPGMTTILGGDKALRTGDMVAFHGPIGASKTLAGLRFLCAPNDADCSPGRSLLVADLSTHAMGALLELIEGKDGAAGRRKPDIEFCSVTPGYIAPGQLLQRIKYRLEEAQTTGRPVDRVLLTNMVRWELEMPLLRDDLVFVVALMQLLRTYRATAVFILGSGPAGQDSTMTKLMLESAECVLEFSRLEFRGQLRHLVRVVKTRDMCHRRESFELVTDRTGIWIKPTSALLRQDASGNVKPVNVSLFLHSETENHRRYNHRLEWALRTTLSAEAKIKPQNHRYDASLLDLGASSAVDELQILQLDEYQLPVEPYARTACLVSFPVEEHKDLIKDRLPRFRDSVLRDDKKSVIAVPFYENISLLAFRKSLLPNGLPQSWAELSEECVKWDKENPRGVNFACQVESDRFESYNCLLLEILNSLAPCEAEDEIELHDWLSNPKAAEAMRIFARLTRRCHELNFKPGTEEVDPYYTGQLSKNSSARVWRHWYSTINQMLHNMAGDTADIEVRPLFGDRATSGEWYLAVPSYSAAPEVALQVIEFLTTKSRELRRRNLGIGMPTREVFYKEDSPSEYMSPYFHMEPALMSKLVRNAFRRSRIRDYQSIAETIAAHLHHLLESEEKELDSILKSLIADLKFIRKS